MSGRIVARTFATAALSALLVAAGAGTAQASPPPDAGRFPETIELPDGFQPEGITIGPGGTGYVGSLADGDVFVFDVRTGEQLDRIEGPGTPSVGLKVDQRGRLFIAGGPAGDARVVDAETGAVLESYQFTTDPAAFINDVVLTHDGAWFTNSSAAELYFVPVAPSGELSDSFQVLPLTGDWMQTPGFNANGIAETPDHQALLVIQTSTSTLFRVDPTTGEATVVDLGDDTTLANGDGLLVVGRTLYVVQNQLNTVAVVRLDAQGTSGTVVDRLTDSDFAVPTTIARFGSGLYLPNARFGTPPTPDTEYDVVRIDR
jgi:sugar lactone lactonase YvrE